jgi:hypothetical protein
VDRRLVARAEHALRTNQPHLAELYMRRALNDSPEGRRWLRRQAFRAEIEALAKRCGMVIEAFIPGRDITTRADYALANADLGWVDTP